MLFQINVETGVIYFPMTTNSFNNSLLKRYSSSSSSSVTATTVSTSITTKMMADIEKSSPPLMSNNNDDVDGNKILPQPEQPQPPKKKNLKRKGMKAIASQATIPSNRYSDFGGIKPLLSVIEEIIEAPFRYPALYRHLGTQRPRGVILHGPSGCGKTMLAQAIAGELQIPLIKINAPELISGTSGESESRIRDIFAEAKKMSPCILFIDELDSITPKRDTSSKGMDNRIVAQLLSSMDDLYNDDDDDDDCCRGADGFTGVNGITDGTNNNNNNTKTDKHIMIIGATNRPDTIDPALRRSGRFDRELALTVPSLQGRSEILSVLMKKLRISPEDHINDLLPFLSTNTPGFVGADLMQLMQEATNSSIKRITAKIDFSFESMESYCIEKQDFIKALSKVQPSSKREGFAQSPNTSWNDIGALKGVREEIRDAVVNPLKYPKIYTEMGVDAPAGVLLWGPPGCGKTLLAKAVASESHSNFISVKGPELLNKYVGESERAVRGVFEKARQSAPCIIFFDEIDALCPRREGGGGASVDSRMVNQLLTEMDGMNSRRDVFVMGATNRPDIIDPAMTRPGRLDRLLYVGLPNAEERLDILKRITSSRRIPLASTLLLDDNSNSNYNNNDNLNTLRAIANNPRCDGFSGADIGALVREASMKAVKEVIERQQQRSSVVDGDKVVEECDKVVTYEHFEAALLMVQPSISKEDRDDYEHRLQGRMQQ